MESKKIVRNQKGFTLVEVIAVLVIIAILAAIAVPKYMQSIETARINSARNAINELIGRCNQAYADCLLAHDGQTGACGAAAIFADARITANPPNMGGFTLVVGAAAPDINIRVTAVDNVAVAPQDGVWREPHTP